MAFLQELRKKIGTGRLIKGFIYPLAVLSQREIISPLSTKSAIFNTSTHKTLQFSPLGTYSYYFLAFISKIDEMLKS